MALSERRFTEVVAFSEDEAQRSTDHWRHALVGKFLGRGFPREFVHKEMKVRWKIAGDFHVSLVSEGLFLFVLSSEEKKA